MQIGEEFSSRFERHGDDLVSIDIGGLERLLGPPRAIGEATRRTLAVNGVRAHVAIARIRMSALVLAHACPGLTVVDPGKEADALAPLAVSVLRRVTPGNERASVGPGSGRRVADKREDAALFESALRAIEHWGIGTLGELAAL